MIKPKKIGPLSFVVRFILGFTWLAVWSTIGISLMILALPFRTLRIKIGNLCGKIIGPVITRIVGTKIVNNSQDKLNTSTPAIFVTNHSSALDVFISMRLCPYGGCGVGKKEVAKIPFLGWAYWLSGHLLIDRSNTEKAIASMAKLSDFVKKNNLSIWIWPEGTRSLDGKLIPFKKGFVHLALATGLPVVPVVLHGSYKRWPAKTMAFYPGEVNIEVLDAIDTKSWKKDTIDAHVNHVKSIMSVALG